MARYPKECPVFACDEANSGKDGPWGICVGVGFGESVYLDHLSVLAYGPTAPAGWLSAPGLIAAKDLRPLTPAARAMLALVKP